MHSSHRLQYINPFYVMELVKKAQLLQSQGHDIIKLSIGEPDFTAPIDVQQAALKAINEGNTHYTPALGILPLREKLSEWYQKEFNVNISPSRIVITNGASGALLLAIAALVNPDDYVLMADPCYPCNRHFVSNYNAIPQLIPVEADSGFQLTAAQVASNWREKTVGVTIASPSNPTGTVMNDTELKDMIQIVKQHQGFLIVDEIYQHLVYGQKPTSVLQLVENEDDAKNLFVLNSFSKYFCMTGWRLGWMVIPEGMAEVFERLQQNFYICPSTVAQYAALGCFTNDSIDYFNQCRDAFGQRRDKLLPALREMGFEVPITPEGAFYIYANSQKFGLNSCDLANRVLHEAHVAIVPGKDFGIAAPQHFVRFSYANSLERIETAINRMGDLLSHY